MVKGYLYPSDGRNLGLHEMGHALKFEDRINNEEVDFLDYDVLIKYEGMAAYEMERIRGGDTSFFREYAGTNREEFFAVAVENFFERPQEFYNYNAQLYLILSKLINQDPRNNIVMIDQPDNYKKYVRKFKQRQQELVMKKKVLG